MKEHEKRIREALNQRHAGPVQMKDWDDICNPAAIHALLADLDAMRGAAKKLVDAVNYKAAAMAGFADPEKIDFANECVWRAVDQTTRALKGAEA